MKAEWDTVSEGRYRYSEGEMAWEMTERKRKGDVRLEARTMPCAIIIMYGQGTEQLQQQDSDTHLES